MDIWQYMLQKEREFKKFSVTPEQPLHEMFQAAPDSQDGKRGRVLGRLIFNDDAYMDVLERIVVRGNSVHRDRYAYALILDGVHEYSWERHKTHDPAVHEHEGSGRIRRGTQPVSLAVALELSWEMVSLRAEAEVLWEEES